MHGNSFEDNNKHMIVDISSMYEGQLKSAERGIFIVGNSYVKVQDEIINTGKSGNLRWARLCNRI